MRIWRHFGLPIECQVLSYVLEMSCSTSIDTKENMPRKKYVWSQFFETERLSFDLEFQCFLVK